MATRRAGHMRNECSIRVIGYDGAEDTLTVRDPTGLWTLPTLPSHPSAHLVMGVLLLNLGLCGRSAPGDGRKGRNGVRDLAKNCGWQRVKMGSELWGEKGERGREGVSTLWMEDGTALGHFSKGLGSLKLRTSIGCAVQNPFSLLPTLLTCCAAIRDSLVKSEISNPICRSVEKPPMTIKTSSTRSLW